MPSHILLLLGIPRAVTASRTLLHRVFPSLHMITLSSAGPCHNYTEFIPLLHMPLARHSPFSTSICMSISQGSDVARQPSMLPSNNKFKCVRVRRCTLFWPNLLRFFECIHPSIDQLCSHPEAEHESPPSLIATHCTDGQ